jgi:hypothetical protein
MRQDGDDERPGLEARPQAHECAALSVAGEGAAGSHADVGAARRDVRICRASANADLLGARASVKAVGWVRCHSIYVSFLIFLYFLRWCQYHSSERKPIKKAATGKRKNSNSSEPFPPSGEM